MSRRLWNLCRSRSANSTRISSRGQKSSATCKRRSGEAARRSAPFQAASRRFGGGAVDHFFDPCAQGFCQDRFISPCDWAPSFLRVETGTQKVRDCQGCLPRGFLAQLAQTQVDLGFRPPRNTKQADSALEGLSALPAAGQTGRVRSERDCALGPGRSFAQKSPRTTAPSCSRFFPALRKPSLEWYASTYRRRSIRRFPDC